MSKEQVCDVIELAKEFNLDISSELMANNLSSEENMVRDKSSFTVPFDDIDLDSNQKLKIKTTMVSKYGSLTLSFPECRSSRKNRNQIEVYENLTGFDGRIQKEYNTHPVGKYMGPYDQNKNLKLRIQLPDSHLDFQNYTEFCHDGKECFALDLKSNGSYSDLDKIDAHKIASKIVDVEDSNSDSDEEHDRKTMSTRGYYK